MPCAARNTILLLALAGGLYGCGNEAGGEKPTAIEAATPCINCHSTMLSPGTGAHIVEEWKASAHNTANAASCRDCHDPAPGHPNKCSNCHNGPLVPATDEVTRNPDAAGKCLRCHNAGTGYDPADVVAGLTVNTQTAHFNLITSSGYPGSFVTYNYVGNCRKCHNPHNPTRYIAYNQDWARSAHGTSAGLAGANDFRYKAREEFDFKTAGTYRPASQALSDNTAGTYEVCLRCHTSTGYINYVTSGFSSLRPFGPSGPDGLPYRMDAAIAANPAVDKSKIAPPASGKELTNCNVCHDDGKGVAYSFKLRKVPQVTSFYNYSAKRGVGMTGGAVRNFGIQYPDAGDSNLCIPCHSGRLVGMVIKMADARGLDFSKSSRLVNHFRGAAQLMYQTGGFEFYSSNSSQLRDYSSDVYSHRYIGMNRVTPIGTGPYAGDLRGHGPCIGCHLNSNGSDQGATSHTFLPFNREAGDTYLRDISNPSQPITVIASKACPACHRGDEAWTPAALQAKKDQFKAAVIAFREILLFALNSSPTTRKVDSENRPTTPTNWYGSNASGARIQPWLRSNTTPANSDGTLLSYYVPGALFIDPVDGNSYGIRRAAYTMGAAFNFFMLYYDPGAFAHNDAYVKRLIYDSIDWLDDGQINGSVSATFNGTLIGAADSFNLKSRLAALGVDWQAAYDYLMGETQGGRPQP